jgi:ABC-type polysaccharide/polyol phosphate export permease
MADTSVPTTLPHKTLRQALAELHEARFILSNLIRRDFASQYKNNFLGVGWSLLNPLMLVAIYTVAFQYLLGAPTTPDWPYSFALYLYSGLVIWNLFNVGVIASTSSISGNAFLINRVYIPREVFPLSVVGSACITFIFEFIVLAVFMAIFGAVPGPKILLAPLFPALAALLAVGCGLFMAALGVRFRDLQHFVSIAFQALFWATPIVYNLTLIENRLGPKGVFVMKLNPITPIILGFRNAVVLNVWPEWGWLGYSFGVALMLCAVGYWLFQRQEPYFPELI